MFHSIVCQGIPMDHQLPSFRSPGRRHNSGSYSTLDYRFGVRNCCSAFWPAERHPIGGGRCGSYRSQSLQNLSVNRGNPMFGDYQGFGGREVLGSSGSFGGGNYSGSNQRGRTHRSGCRGCFSGDSYHRRDLGSGSGSIGGLGHGEKNPGRAVGRSHSSCLGGLGGLGDCNGGNSGGKSGCHSGESNGDTGGCGDGKTYSRQDQNEKCENNYVDLEAHGRHSEEGSLGGHLGRRGNICDIGQGRTQRVHISESIQNPVQVDTDPEIQRVRMEETEQIKNLKRQCDSCINKVHILEQRNTVLSIQWELLQQQRLARKSLQNTESLFQSYMQDTRMLLNTVRGQKGQLLSELRQLQAVTEDCEKRHKEELNKRLASEKEFVALKKDIDTAHKDNMDLDVKTDLLIEQIVRLRGIYEMELTELQRRVHDGTNDIVFMNNHRHLNIDNSLEEVRCRYEEIAQRSKEEVDARCQGKYEELHTMCGIHHEHLHNSRQELQELTHHIQTLKMEIGKLKKKNTRLQETIADSEQRGDRALQDAKEKLHDLEHALQKAGNKFIRLQRDFQEQLNDKLALEIETTICRKQLERGDCRLNQVSSVHSFAGGGYSGERRAPSSTRNNRNSGGLCDSGGGNDTSEMHYGSRSQGYSSRRGSNIFGATACSGSRTYSFGSEECSSKRTNSSTTRECDQKGMGISASEVCTLAAGGDSDRPGREGHYSRDISSVKGCIKSQTDYRHGGSASGTVGGGGLGDSEGGRNSGSGGQGSRNICSFGEGVCSPSTCESGGYSFGISSGRCSGSSGNVGLESGGYSYKEGAESGANGGRLSYEAGRDESIQPPEYRNSYGNENSKCTQSPGNREFGSRGIRNSGGIVHSPIASESRRYSSGNRINPGGSRYGSGVQVSFGRGRYSSQDEPTCESGRNDSIPPSEYESCYEGERSSGSRELGSRGIFGSRMSNLWPYESRENSSGSGMCGSEGSGLTGTTGGRSGSGNEEYGSRIMNNPKGRVCSSGVYGTRRYSSEM